MSRRVPPYLSFVTRGNALYPLLVWAPRGPLFFSSSPKLPMIPPIPCLRRHLGRPAMCSLSPCDQRLISTRRILSNALPHGCDSSLHCSVFLGSSPRSSRWRPEPSRGLSWQSSHPKRRISPAFSTTPIHTHSNGVDDLVAAHEHPEPSHGSQTCSII